MNNFSRIFFYYQNRKLQNPFIDWNIDSGDKMRFEYIIKEINLYLPTHTHTHKHIYSRMKKKTNKVFA